MLSTLNSFDFKVDGTPFELPAGKVGFAVGVSYVRRRSFGRPRYQQPAQFDGHHPGMVQRDHLPAFRRVRNFHSGFAEVNVPISGPSRTSWARIHHVDAAVRYDSYSGKVGSSTDPQVNPELGADRTTNSSSAPQRANRSSLPSSTASMGRSVPARPSRSPITPQWGSSQYGPIQPDRRRKSRP